MLAKPKSCSTRPGAATPRLAAGCWSAIASAAAVDRTAGSIPRLDAGSMPAISCKRCCLDADRRLVEFLAAGKMPFHLWLRCLARDRLIDAHRHHRRAARRSLDREQPLPQTAWSDQSAIDLGNLVRDRGATPAAAAMGRELEARFQAALDQLDETDREIVLLRHFEQMSNSEAAESLGLSPPAAGMRYLRAMRRLRTLLAEVPSQRGTR